MSSTRPPAVAGTFYPADSRVLHSSILEMLSAVPETTLTPKALIVPHAGYIYSGPIAASAYAQLSSIKHQVNRVILLGPSHRVPLVGLATSSADSFETPLGIIHLDKQLIAELQKFQQVQQFDQSHAYEHSLEVQLPFLQTVLDNFSLVPIVVGEASAEEVHQVIEYCWGGNETLIVISSDLSHYHDYDTANKIDSSTCHAIENFDAKAIHYEQACGRNPVIGLLKSAQKHNLKVSTLDLRNSGDTAGDKQRVVGYGAWAFTQN